MDRCLRCKREDCPLLTKRVETQQWWLQAEQVCAMNRIAAALENIYRSGITIYNTPL